MPRKSHLTCIEDPYHIAWNRLNHVLQRMNFEIMCSEFKSGLSAEGVFIVKSNVVETVEEKGFFDFGGSEKRIREDFTLVLSEETHEVTRVILKMRRVILILRPKAPSSSRCCSRRSNKRYAHCIAG